MAEALFTRVQQRVLGILFGQPERSFLSKEVITLASIGTGAVHRELQRLVRSGLVTVRSEGWEKHYQANPDSPIFAELKALVVKTVGLVEPIREALAPIATGIRFAFVYGSQARGVGAAGSDVDLMIVSDVLTYSEVFAVLEKPQAVLTRSIQPTVLTWAEWVERLRAKDHFLQIVRSQPRLFILGAEDDPT